MDEEILLSVDCMRLRVHLKYVFATSLMSRGCKRSVDYFAPRRKVVAFFLGDAGTGTVSLSQEENMTVAGTAKLLLFTNEQGKTNNNCC